MTGHKSKGREYEFVYVPFLRDGYWGGKRKRNKFSISVGVYANHELSGNLDDERRLFYVALTRAKKQAVISFSRIDAEGKEFIPSVFIDEIRDDLLTREHIPTESVDGGLVLHTKKDPVSLYDKGYIQDIFINQGFSVTALNNFLDCSWKFFYRNLIRIPSVYTPPQSFGNAIHYALHRMYQNAKESGVFDTKALIAAFEYKLQTEILSPQDYDDLYKKGVEVLKSYVEAYEHTFKTDALTEYTIKGVVVPFVYGDSSYELPLRGNIDKLEPYLDGYKVTDYKTGKRKTRNELLGKTKNSDGGYWRQIVFYKLLLDLYDTEAFSFRKGEIIFVVPDAKCVIHSEEFDVEDADIDILKEEIRYAATEIMELKFSENACGKKDCEYCAML